MKREILAIIIPYYKITFFDKCLKSLADQTNKNFNVYIGNDNSPNDPSDLIEKYKYDFNLTYVKFENNLGGTTLVKHWDRCINLSNDEEWIMILGDDDVLENNVVENFYKKIFCIDNNIKVLRFASQLIDTQDQNISNVFYNPEVELAKDYLIRCLNGEARSSLSEHIFKRKSYEKYGFKDFPVAFGSDNLAWLEFPEMGKVIAINSAIVKVRISSENISSKSDRIIGFKRKEGIYLYTKYIVENYGEFFNKNEKIIILNKSYSSLRIFDRSIQKTIVLILKMIFSIGFVSTYKIIRNNRKQ